jgi:hypothetical protein
VSDVDSFVIAATGRRFARAERMLAARPEIERDPWVRLVVEAGNPIEHRLLEEADGPLYDWLAERV